MPSWEVIPSACDQMRGLIAREGLNHRLGFIAAPEMPPPLCEANPRRRQSIHHSKSRPGSNRTQATNITAAISGE